MKKHVLLFLFLLASSHAAQAQLVSFGVTGGVPLIDRIRSNDESRPYIVGPSIEFALPAGFAVEADALYQRLGNTGTFSFLPAGVAFPPAAGVSFFNDRLRANSWEFPLIGKYYFRPRDSTWQPFLGTGYAFRTVGLHQAINQAVLDAAGNATSSSFKIDSRSATAVGATFTAGLRYRLAALHSPRRRATRIGVLRRTCCAGTRLPSCWASVSSRARPGHGRAVTTRGKIPETSGAPPEACSSG